MAMRFEARGRFRVTPEKLWPLVSDTHRMNHAMGLPVMTFEPRPLETGGSLVIGQHPAGSSLLAFLNQIVPLGARRVTDGRLLRWLPGWPIVRWVEHPFEFEAPRRYSVWRDYFWAPLGLFPFRSVRAIVELVPTDDGGTEVVSAAEVEPRNPLGALVARLVVGPRSVQAVVDQCRNFERFLLGQAAHPFPDLVVAGPEPPSPPRPSESPASGPVGARSPAPTRREAADAWERLARSGVAPELSAALRRHLETAPDDEVLKMRPFELADRWGVERRETLVGFLHGTTAGVLEMSWDVLCPGCRLSKLSVGSIDAVQGQVHCDFCNISFDAALDQQVEVRFSVAESLRQVDDRRFCTGGPMNTPHVIAQAELAPGEARVLAAPLGVGPVRVRSLQSKRSAILDVQHGAEPAERELTLTPAAIIPPGTTAAPGTVRVRVVNRSELPATLLLEDPGWPDTAATASVVATIQEFRDLFDSQVLAPGLQLAIQRLAFLFTDLTGSTALYQKVGQARAFRLVHDHFRILFGVVAAHRGAVVKTIGDAVMGAFPTGADAVACALTMQRAIRDLETDGAIDPARLLKVGIHEGPCIAVTANGRLDYFGTTINTAARVEHECRGGQIVLTGEVHRDPAVQAIVRGAGVEMETAEVQLRGVAEPVRIYRIGEPVV